MATTADVNKELSSELLEDVFNQIDSLEKSENATKKPRFLESETELFSNEKKVAEKNTHELSTFKSIEQIDSLIHDGLTDSSDDEENKYFEEAKYNQCGRDIKKLIKEKESTRRSFLLEAEPINNKDKDKDFSLNARLAREKLQKHLDTLEKDVTSPGVVVRSADTTKNTSSAERPNLLVDPILNMRIINPLVSSTVLKEKMIGRMSVGTLKIKNFLLSPTWKTTDWVTGGVIISKLCKTSQKGNQYCIWNVSDLMGDIKTVTIFLFGSAYADFWKTSLGTVVGILNPAVMDGNEKSEATLRVDNAHKILIMGTSKDYGICRSKKKNGDPCSSVVNTAKCEFCTYHLGKEYTKACRRSDLQPPKIGNGLNGSLRQKILGKNDGFGKGKVFAGIRGRKSSKNAEKDRKRLEALSQMPVTENPCRTRTPTSAVSEIPMGKSKPPSLGDATPKAEVRMIDLNLSITKRERNAARQRALNYVRKNGPIRKMAEDDRGKRTPEQIASIKRKLEGIEEETGSNKKQKGANEPLAEAPEDPMKKKLERIGMTDKFFRLMNSGVKNEEFLKMAETDQREKYFDKLETREKMEEKMASTFKVECHAVRCLKCHYKAFSASDLCKKEKHPLKVFKAFKRFWKCTKCSARTVSLELFPVHSCKTCGSSNWEKVSMMAEKGPNLMVEPLSLRGMEEKFIGSAVKNANLNLLVPENGS